MAERVLITASREYPTMDDVVQYVATLAPDTIVVEGEAQGMDRAVILAAEGRGLTVERYPADWSKGTRAGYARSAEMVARADRVVVFRAGGSPSTMYTIREAVRAGKPTLVFSPEWAPYPDGLAGVDYPGAGGAAKEEAPPKRP
jgi:YspA, cpYpsA-related SLOG family